MKKKENRDSKDMGRRSIDKLTPGMILATGLVSLMGAPTKIVVQWGMPSFLAWIVGDALLKIVHELKGTTTLANIQIGLRAVLSVNPEPGKEASSWPLGCELLVYLVIGLIVIAGVAIFYAYRERKLRHQTIQEMGQQITLLEKFIDANRSTSGLSKTGETHPKDR